MPEKREVKVYKFDELSERAKKRVLEREYEDELELVENILEDGGALDYLNDTLLPKYNLAIEGTPRLGWSVSYSQGDYANVSGRFIWMHNGKYYRVKAEAYRESFTAEDITITDDEYNDLTDYDDLYDTFKADYNSMNKEFYHWLRSYFDDATSEENLKAHINDNEYLFYSDGSIYNESD